MNTLNFLMNKILSWEKKKVITTICCWYSALTPAWTTYNLILLGNLANYILYTIAADAINGYFQESSLTRAVAQGFSVGALLRGVNLLGI